MVFLTFTPNSTYKKVTSWENFAQHTFYSSDQENFYNSTLTGAVLGWDALETETTFCRQHFNLWLHSRWLTPVAFWPIQNIKLPIILHPASNTKLLVISVCRDTLVKPEEHKSALNQPQTQPKAGHWGHSTG